MVPALPQKRDAPSQSPGEKPQRFVHSNPAQTAKAAKALSNSTSANGHASSTPTTGSMVKDGDGDDGGNVTGGDDEEGFTKVLTKEERRKLRKVEKNKPQFQFDIGQFRSGKKIGIAHVRDFVLYLLTDGNKPQWIVAENKGNISHVVVLMIPGLLPSHIGLDIPIAANLPFTTQPVVLTSDNEPPNSRVPIINQTFLRGIPTRAPGDNRKLHSVIQTLLQSPLTDARRKEMEREREAEKIKAALKNAAAPETNSDSPPFSYLLTPNQMLDNGYNLPSYIRSGDEVVVPGRTDVGTDGYHNGVVAGPSKLPSADKLDPAPLEEGWAETPAADGPPSDGRWPVLAVDCEMVETSKGVELARVSIVDYDTGLVVFDELVKPPDPVTNYRTQWSGMTQARMAHASHTIATIQHALLLGPAAILTPHTILLGHSLECDLNALHIRHPLCIDTALLYKHPRGAPYKPALRWLSQRYLGKEIQGGKGGHDSEEDARACVGLLKEKIVNGIEFGSFTEYTESIFDRLTRHTGPTSAESSEKPKGLTSLVCDYSNPKTGHGARATTCLKCDSDDEVVDSVLANVGAHDMVFARLMQLANHSGFNGPENTPPDARPLSDALSILNTQIARLINGLPKHTALILLNGHSDPRPMVQLAQRRAAWERAVREAKGDPAGVVGQDRWMAEDDRSLEESVAKAREGMAFFCVK